MFLLLLCLCNFPMVFAMDPEIVDLLTPLSQIGEKCGYDGCPVMKEGYTMVHIVPHSHAELGLSRTFNGHFTGYDDFLDHSQANMKRILDATISELWADRRRTFTLSDSELPYFFHWWSMRDGTVRRMVYELIRQGRLSIVGGGWGMHDEASTYYQALIDSYTYSLRKINATFLSCGRPLVAWQADMFGHSREYASLVAQMGFDALFVNPISFDDEMIRMERKGLEFMWRGSDDLGSVSDIFTHKLFDGYWSPPGFCFGSTCSDPLLVSSDSMFKNLDERAEEFLNIIRYRQAPHYGTNHVMVIMGEKFGYFIARTWFKNIDKLIDHVNEKTSQNGTVIYLTYSTPACYLKAVHNANPILETKQDDFFPFAYDKFSYASGMYTSRPALKFLIKEANIYLQMSKQLQVLARPGNNDQLLEEFMWTMGVAQDHGVISGAMRDFVLSDYTKKIYLAVQRSTELLDASINKLRGCPPNTIYFRCIFNESSCPNTRHYSSYIVVYNPLAWPVTMPIRIPILKKKYDVYNPKGLKIRSVIIPTPLQMQSLQHLNRSKPAEFELVFIAEHLPPLGYRSYYILESATRGQRGTDKLHILPNRQTSGENKAYLTSKKTPKKQNFGHNITYFTGRSKRSLTYLSKNNRRTHSKSVSRDKRTFFIGRNKRSDNNCKDRDSRDDTSKRNSSSYIKKTLIKKFNETPKNYYVRSRVLKLSKNDIIYARKKSSLIYLVQKNPQNHSENSKGKLFNAHKKRFLNKVNRTLQNYMRQSSRNITFFAQGKINLINMFKKQSFRDNLKFFALRKRYLRNKLRKQPSSATTLPVRRKRSLIKKLNKNPQKYFIRQTSRDNTTVFEGNQDYEYIEEDIGSKIDFGNISKVEENVDYSYIVTPKYKVAIETTEHILIPSTETEEFPDDVPDTTEVLHQDTTPNDKVTQEAGNDNIPDSYYFVESDDMFIKNKYIQINLDEYRKISNITLSNGIQSTLDIQYYFYVSDDPLKMGTKKKNPGVYIFRPMDNKPEAIIDFIHTKVYKSEIVQEIHCGYSKYASFALKLYADSPIVEIDWLLGPVPIEDGFGKEVFLRYATDLENGGIFYTDANARQTVKRIRNKRALYEPYNLDPVAGNFYPVTSRIYIEDLNKNMRLSIFNDRSQGGTSLVDGTIDLMLNRRILTDDIRANIVLNDTDNESGIIRGTHYLYLTKANYKQNRVFEKKFSKENELKPQIMVSSVKQIMDKNKWLGYTNEFSALNSKLPIGVHLLTLQEWNDRTLLIRLENYLEKIDVVQSGVKRVFLKDLFFNIKIKEAKETMLAANIMMEDFVPLQWLKNEKFVRNFNDFYGGNRSESCDEEYLKPFENVVLEDGIILIPQQIRTFVVWFDYK